MLLVWSKESAELRDIQNFTDCTKLSLLTVIIMQIPRTDEDACTVNKQYWIR